MKEPEAASSTASPIELEAIALRLRELISSSGLDQREFAERIGIPYSTLRAYVSAGRAPSAEFLVALRRVLGVSANWLLTGTGSEPTERDQPRRRLLTAEESPLQQAVDEQLRSIQQAKERARGESARSEDSLRRLIQLQLHQLAPGAAPGQDLTLSHTETILIANYREASAEGQAALRQLAAFVAEYQRRQQEQSQGQPTMTQSTPGPYTVHEPGPPLLFPEPGQAPSDPDRAPRR